MDTSTQAQLYLSDQRGCSQTDFFRSYHVFNFGSYVAEARNPFGTLRVLNDNTLAAGHGITMQVEQHTDVLILPLLGGLEYESTTGNGFLETGQAQLFSLRSGMDYVINNPYETESINYLEIWLTNSSPAFTPTIIQMPVDLSVDNKLMALFSVNHTGSVSTQQGQDFIGRYAGRAEDSYHPRQRENGVFVFVLSGVFEVQNRLLHQRDGLSLTNVQNGEVDFEALSNDAVLLLLEVPQ
jgi:redox-sensitive bicupin YhaK (pirin superfamily)